MQLRMTNQREIILRELIKSRRHLTADELYDIVKKAMPRISLATVYRNLEILSGAGMIGKLEISGRQKRFDYNSSEHDHIYCVVCHRVDNLEMAHKGLGAEEFGAVAGYSVTGYRLEIVGVCPECQKKKDNKEKKIMSGCGCGCSCASSSKGAGGESKLILEALAKCEGPCGSKDIAQATGLDKKVVGDQIAELKKKGLVDSPVRCKYGITAAGKASI